MKFSKVTRRIHRSEDFLSLSPIPPCGRGLFLYLLTCPEMTAIPGVILAGKAALAEALDWDTEAFQEAFREASDKGMVKADWKRRIVWLPKALNHNTPESPNVVRHWGSVFDELPDSPLKSEIFRVLRDSIEGLGEGFRKAFREAFAKSMPNQEPEQEHEPEPEQEPKGERSASPKAPRRVDDPGGFVPGVWTEAVSKASGIKQTSPSVRERQALHAVCEAHAPSLRGQVLLDWVAALAVEFVAHAKAEGLNFGGFGTDRLRKWLDAGKPKARPPKGRTVQREGADFSDFDRSAE